MTVAKIPKNILQKMDSYSEYTKASINSYMNTMTMYNITITTDEGLKIRLEPNSESDPNRVYYIEGTITL